MVFNNLIEAIKHIRGTNPGTPTIEKNGSGEYVIHMPSADMGLKEAKDYCEAVMALGVKRYLESELRKVTTTSSTPSECFRCGRTLTHHEHNLCSLCKY